MVERMRSARINPLEAIPFESWDIILYGSVDEMEIPNSLYNVEQTHVKGDEFLEEYGLCNAYLVMSLTYSSQRILSRSLYIPFNPSKYSLYYFLIQTVFV